MKFRNLLRRFVAAICLTAASTSLLPAQAQSDLTSPTAWVWLSGATIAEINTQITNGYRVVDLEIVDNSPLRITAAFVRNTGPYNKTWYWYVGQSAANVNSLLAQNNARLIDVEPYQTVFGLRYAVVMISNTGSDFASGHGWQVNMTASGVVNWFTANPSRRLLDIQPYNTSGGTRYAFVWVANSGTQQSGWWYYIGATRAQIDTFLGSNNARLVDLERTPGASTYSAVMVPGDGKSTYHLYQLSASQVTTYINQFASRIIDIEYYIVGFSPRFDIILRQNDNDLAISANNLMRSHLSLSASSGHSLVRIDSGLSTLAGVKEDDVFEPASLMKTAHLFTAFRRVFFQQDNLNATLTVLTGTNGSCPNGTGPVTRTLSQTLSRMMEISSNQDTEAIRARYGTNVIESNAANVGASNIQLNHTIGCLCGSSRNQATLMDFAKIHRAVANGLVGNFEGEFHQTMLNGSSFGSGIYNTISVMNAEIAAANLTSQEENAFRNGLTFAHKGGSYSCGGGTEQHRSIGAYVRIPFRNGCTITDREYFIGAWVNDSGSATNANNGLGAGITTLWRQVLKDALASWNAASCDPFQTYCTAVPNSSGATGKVTTSGTSSVIQNNFSMGAMDLPQNVFTFLLVGTQMDFVPFPGGSLGNLCVGGSIGRYHSSLQSTGSAGNASHYVNLDFIPTPGPGTYQVQPGDTLFFQWWHRDTVNSAPASNFTNGLRATFNF